MGFEKSNEFLNKFEQAVRKHATKLNQSQIDTRFILWNVPTKENPKGIVDRYRQVLSEELKDLNDKDIYFDYCKFNTYESTYDLRLKAYLKKFEDAENIHFIGEELQNHIRPIHEHRLFQDANEQDSKNLGLSRNKTLSFLLEKAKKEGRNIEIIEDYENGVLPYLKWQETKKDVDLNYSNDLRKQEIELLDHSYNKDIDRVRTLILLGVVDDLYKKPEYKTSIGFLATALSGVTGIKANTMRGYLNAYLSNPIDKNNPMNKEKEVQKVKNRLGIQ